MSLRRRSLLFILTVLGLLAASVVVVAVKPTVLGLDLRGGSQAILEGRDTAQAQVTPEAMDRAVGVIRDRVDKLGVAEAEIQRIGSNQISVAVPNIEDPTVIEDLVKAAQLSLYAYEPNLVGRVPGQGAGPNNPTTDLYALIQLANETPVEGEGGTGKSYYLFRADDAHTFVAGPQLSEEDLIKRLEISDPAVAAEYAANPKKFEIATVPEGLIILTDGTQVEPGEPVTPCGEGGLCVLLQDNVGLTGNDLEGANLGFDSLNQPTVQMQFTGAGRDKFAEVTREIARGAAAERRPGSIDDSSWHFAIALDGTIISSPFVDYQQYPSGIDSDSAEISGGGFTEQTARTLADQLSSGAVPIQLDTVNLQKVSATLGQQSLDQGLIAGLVGLLLVMVALIAYYRVLGVIACVSLAVYGMLFWAIAKLVPIALTLPGIAGLILTIGVAADASVVIFERVREESRAGRPPRTALLNGYKRGITAIIDANIVTLVTAVFIFLLSSAGPRGFAFTLILGVLLSLFTAIIFTQGAFGLLIGTKLFENEKLMGFNAREIKWKMDVVGRWKMWLSISFVPLVIGLVFIGFNGLTPGLDFSSGTRISVAFTQQQPTENDLRERMSASGIDDPKIQEFTRTGESGEVSGFEITTKPLTTPQTEALISDFESAFGPTDPGIENIETVGPTFGRDIVRSAIWAIVFSFLAIIAYLTFRFEYKLALPALASVVHDVWLALTIYSIAGKEVTGATVAAFLTILGYSLYDVVILFDRIRENIPLMKGKPYREVVNRSIHETLTRSIITMVLTLLPIIALLLFGGETLFDFSFALLVGIISGGISSIFISGPLAALWKEREPDARKAAARQARKAARAAQVDADIMDVSAFTRAEAALESGGAPGPGEELVDDASSNGAGERLADDVPAATAVLDAPDDAAAAAAASDDGDDDASDVTPPPEGPAPPPERPRRHQNVRRRRRGR
jgi:SecD/SecF fusion protein